MGKPLRQANTVLPLLIAEDDDVSRDLLGIIIAKKFPAFTIYFAENGRVGLELFKRHMPFIVITDINMPDMDGIQMAREIRALKSDTKFIVLTAYSYKDYQDKFNEIGFNAYILKPIVFGKLFDAIENCLAEITLERH